MPFIRVSMMNGRSHEQREALIKALTDTTAKILEIPKEWVHILIEDVAGENWGIGGIPVSKLPKEK